MRVCGLWGNYCCCVCVCGSFQRISQKRWCKVLLAPRRLAEGCVRGFAGPVVPHRLPGALSCALHLGLAGDSRGACQQIEQRQRAEYRGRSHCCVKMVRWARPSAVAPGTGTWWGVGVACSRLWKMATIEVISQLSQISDSLGRTVLLETTTKLKVTSLCFQTALFFCNGSRAKVSKNL